MLTLIHIDIFIQICFIKFTNKSNLIYNIILSVPGRIDPPITFGSEGLEAQFYCKSHTKPTWVYDGMYKHYGFLTTNNYRFTDNGRNIRILNITDVDIGYYECSGTMSNGDSFIARALLKLIIGKCKTIHPVTIASVVPFGFKSDLSCQENNLYLLITRKYFIVVSQ